MILLGLVASVVVTGAIGAPLIRLLRRRDIVDAPGDRNLHRVPTPRGGGIAPLIGASVGGLLVAATGSPSILAVIGTAVAFGVLGLGDDMVGLAASVRLVAQVAIALVAAPLLVWSAGGSATAVLVLEVVGALWLVSYVNAFNFMDGANGMSCVQAVTAGGAWLAIGLWQDEQVVAAGGAVIAAAGLAFLPYNFPQAKAFLGDVGSYFFGGWLAATAVVALTAGLAPETVLAPLLLYLADTGSTLVRRALRRQPLTQAHRDHTYQQLVLGGWSHTRTSLVVGATIVACTALGAVSSTGNIVTRLAADVAIAALLGTYLLAPYLQRHTSQARSVGPVRATSGR